MLSIDELNVDISRTGERRRARGDAPRPRVYLLTSCLGCRGIRNYHGRGGGLERTAQDHYI
jgi:hypothetical protein